MKYRTQIRPGALNAADLCRAYWLKSAIKQAEQQEEEEGYNWGELADKYRKELHDLLESSAQALKAYA